MGYPHVRIMGKEALSEGERLLKEERGGRGKKAAWSPFPFLFPNFAAHPPSFLAPVTLIRTDSPGKDRGHIPCRVSLLPFRSVAILPPGSL